MLYFKYDRAHTGSAIYDNLLQTSVQSSCALNYWRPLLYIHYYRLECTVCKSDVAKGEGCEHLHHDVSNLYILHVYSTEG